jgi:membrane-associated phospholipid phosphatase
VRLARAVGIVCCIAAPAAAQSALGPERRDIGDFRGDIWSVVTAPAHAQAHDALPFGGVAAGVVLLSFRDSAIFAWMSTHPNSGFMRVVAPLRDRWRLPIYELGSGQVLLPLSAVAYAAGRLSHAPGLRDAALGCAAGHLSSALLRDVIYLSVSRIRPHDSPDDPYQISLPGVREWGHHSFLSGHIANSMACASYFSHRFTLGPLEPAMYTYVTLIGLGRMADAWHWASDTMAGASMGFAIGKFIAQRQEARLQSRSAALAAGGAPLHLGWTLTF